MNQGFFTKEEVKPNTYQPKKRSNCFTCGLYKHCITPKMGITGKGRKGIFIWAEAPGETEDKRGEQLIGKAGKLLRKELHNIDIDLDIDCWKMNSVNCRPMDKDGNNRTPTTEEINACRQMAWAQVKKLKPKIILLLGGVALESFLGHRWPEGLGGITKWRGHTIPDRDAEAWVIPMFHPSYVLREDNYRPVVRTIFKADLMKLREYLDREQLAPTNEQKCVRILTSEKRVIAELKDIYSAGFKFQHTKPIIFAFDYEATGRKPHAPGHRIVCISFCVRPSEAIAFQMTSGILKWWRRIMTFPGILKTAHNVPFEQSWTKNIYNIDIEGWHFCSMHGTHVLDNRQGTKGLKFQAYANFGLLDYSSHLKKWLESAKNNANAFNQIDKIDIKELMLYCGIDSLMQYRLAYRQMREIGI